MNQFPPTGAIPRVDRAGRLISASNWLAESAVSCPEESLPLNLALDCDLRRSNNRLNPGERLAPGALAAAESDDQMAARIVHFGQELGNRFPLLRSSGYLVDHYETILEFRDALQSNIQHAAISTSEVRSDFSPLVVLTARTYSTAPLILFSTRTAMPLPTGVSENAGTLTASEADYDLVVPASTPSRAWIGEIGALIEHSREVRETSRRIVEQSARLRVELEALIAKTRFEKQRARLECARKPLPDAGPALLVDRLLTCSRCNLEFVFTAGEQLFFQKRNFLNDPKICKSCRSERKGGVPRARPEITLTCAECGVLTSVPFKPTQGRPVLCRSCFERHRVRV
jgi:CxxC-x17-CxxC domain-containing protein